jgi:DNA (cytosine-5)-methyltransferase 1
MIKVGSDFSGVGAFDQALTRLGIKHETIFACDMDKYARQTYIENYGEPSYYPTDVYKRKIPNDPLDLYMTSPPCQAFSQAGSRLGKEDKRGILFFNSHEFIQKNKPRFFIFENVKGLLSHDNGKTFQEWLNFLGGKSINGLPVLFADKNAVPYHIYYKVINAKNLNIPQNRERVFIVGIKDDKDNVFQFPKDEPLTKKLKDVLEKEVDEKYFLDEKKVNKMLLKNDIIKQNNINVIGNTNPSNNGINGNVYHSEGISPTLNTNKGEGIKIKSANSKGYEEATEGDSINFTRLHSETRRGRVGKQIAQSLECISNQAIICKPVQLGQSKQTYAYKSGTIIGKNNQEAFTVRSSKVNGVTNLDTIRRLTPRECFRLMDFPETFTWSCSNSQAYKQAGNSIVVKCLEKIIEKLKL